MNCSISGLSLGYGDKIKMFLLSTPPGMSQHGPIGGFRPTDYWVPRTPPISCYYNDYGRGDGFKEEEIQKLWMEGLKVDLIEQGVGDNQCHDVPATKEMSFEDMLEAVQEQRVSVESKLGRTESKREKEEYIPPEHVPHFKPISEILEKNGHKANHGENSFNVDNVSFGQVRVRVGGYSQKEIDLLNQIKPLFDEKFSSIIINGGLGSGGTKSIELRIFAKPETEWYANPIRDERTSHIALCMVRQDVWDALLKLSYKDWWTEGEHNVQTFYDGMKKFHKDFSEKREKIKNLKELADKKDKNREKYLSEIFLLSLKDDDYNDKNPILYTMAHRSHDFAHFTNSLREHYEIAVEKNLLSDSVLSGIAEISFIESIMGFCRWKWMPTSYAGQDPYWDMNVKFHKVFADVAAAAAKTRYDEDYDYDD